jgi:formylglycine-generating enzyme required for sulfatase activity
MPKLPSKKLLFDCVEEVPSRRPSSAQLVRVLDVMLVSGDGEKSGQVEDLDGLKAAEENEQKRQVEVARLKAAEEVERSLHADLASKRAEEEQKLQAEMARKRAEAEQKLFAEMAKKRADEEQRRLQADLARKRAAEEKRLQAEIARKRREEEQRLLAEIARQKEADEEEQRREAERDLGKVFDFEVVSVNAKGKIINRSGKQARFQVENLGKGVVLEMVSIPGGEFVMGSPETEKGNYSDEKPQHKVTVESFYMGKYAVTQAQWEAVMGNNPSYFKGKNCPEEQVSWDDAVEFCKLLSDMTGRSYRLPSEAEWEYSCRAGTTSPFYFGETITTDLANFNGTSYIYAQEPKGIYRNKTTDVGSFPPNAFGLYDLHGNVWEWCADTWHENYEGAPSDGSVWKEGGYPKRRLLRGGSWNFDNQYYCRSALRNHNTADYRYYDIGFRVALVRAAWT